jgi:hypothetical protein
VTVQFLHSKSSVLRLFLCVCVWVEVCGVLCDVKAYILLVKILLHLMEFNPDVTYMLQSATAEDNVYHKDKLTYSLSA